MGRIKTRIKAPFGEIVLEGENPKEILEILNLIPENFIRNHKSNFRKTYASSKGSARRNS